jgi:Na+-transporting methylmalonyl-CoA/oxaloacetate decarboxylase beta subunit
MKRFLVILNLVAIAPLVVLAIGLIQVNYLAEPIGESGTRVIIGGTEGPTRIFIASTPGPSVLLLIVFYIGLLVWNAVALLP